MAEIKGVGNLGADPVLKYVGDDNDKPVTELRLYLNSGRKGKDGEWIDRGEWFDVSLWGPCAEPAAKLLNKGDRVYLEGTFGIDRWDDPDNGEERSKLKIDANLLLPWLPHLESVGYRPRKGVANETDKTDGADE